jgi:hypothetical protein
MKRGEWNDWMVRGLVKMRRGMVYWKKSNYFLIWLLLTFLLLGSCIHSSRTQRGSVPWKFVLLSDTQGDNKEEVGKSCINGPVLRRIAGQIVKERPDFVLVAGDLVNGWFRNGGTDYATQFANWKSAMEAIYRVGIPVFPIRGNHENAPDRIVLSPLPAHLEPPSETAVLLKQAFRNAFPEAYIPKNGPEEEEGLTYSFARKNAFIVGLDQYGNHPHKVNQCWLDQELTGNSKPHIFVYGHEPAFEVRHRDCLAFYPKDRDAFWDSIGRAGGRVYFCGHDHLYDRAVIEDKAGNPIRQVIAGTAGGLLISLPSRYKEIKRVKGEYSDVDHHGYLLATIEEMKVTIAWKALLKDEGVGAWSILDSFSYTLSHTLN